LFCPSKANSKEDVWPIWILDRFQAPTSGLIGTVGDALYIDGNQKKLRLRCVCIPCNNGWMSALENDAGKILAVLARDIALPLSPEQRALIARWAVLRAMVWEHLAPAPRVPHYLPWDRRAMRAEDAIPANTTVWLARYAGRRVLWSFMADASADPRDPTPDTTARGNVMTIVFGHLCVQVMSHRTLMDDSIVQAPMVPGRWDACGVTVWPIGDRETVDWPPPLSLERDVSLRDFHRRWRSHPER
jgi:hypothetical protein